MACDVLLLLKISGFDFLFFIPSAQGEMQSCVSECPGKAMLLVHWQQDGVLQEWSGNLDPAKWRCYYLSRLLVFGV